MTIEDPQDVTEDQVIDVLDVLAYVGDASIKASRARRVVVRMWAELQRHRVAEDVRAGRVRRMETAEIDAAVPS